MRHRLNKGGDTFVDGQHVLGTLPGLSGPPATVSDVLAANESVRSMLETTVQNQLFLKAKMQGALTASPMQGPTGATGTILIGKCIKSHKVLQNYNKVYHITWSAALWRLWAAFSYITIEERGM